MGCQKRTTQASGRPCRNSRYWDAPCHGVNHAELNSQRTAVLGRIATMPHAAIRLTVRSDFGLLCYLKSIFHFDAQVPYCAFELGMSQEQLHGT